MCAFGLLTRSEGHFDARWLPPFDSGSFANEHDFDRLRGIVSVPAYCQHLLDDAACTGNLGVSFSTT